MSAWTKFAKTECVRLDCEVEMGRVKENPAIKIKFSDGFWMEISHDPSVLEITMKPGNKDHYLKNQARIEHFGFQAAKNFGLYVHERIGGGHINYDLESAFKKNSLLIRNFIVDRANHPELGWGVFGNHLGNAPPFAALASSSKVALYKIIHDFDNGTIKTAEQLFIRIEKEVYTNNPFDWRPDAYAHYQDLSFEKAKADTNNFYRRIEVRGQRPQMSFEHMIKDLELADRNLDYLSSIQKPILLDMPANANYSNSYAISHFSEWAQARGIDPKSYQDIILPPARSAPQRPTAKALNEINDQALYSGVTETFQQLKSEQITDIIKNSSKIGSDNRYLIPHPKMINQEQMERLQGGTAQRLRAILAFQKDIEEKEFKILNSGIISLKILERIAKKAGLEKQELMDLKQRNNIGFYYAPDIVLGSDGNFKVLEDNIGYAGGMGDAMQSRLDLLKLAPEYSSILENHGEGFAKKLSVLLRSEAQPRDGELVLIAPSNQESYNRYYIEQVEAAGIHVVSENKRNGKSISVIDGVPFLIVEKSGQSQKLRIGSVMIRNYSYSGFSNAFPKTMECALSGKLPLLGLPLQRFDLFSDKETTRYIEDFIRFYLNEEPILKTAATISFRDVGANGETLLKKDRLDLVLKNISNYVIKETQGVQGNQVWIGSHLDQQMITKLTQAIEKNPGIYIAQEYVQVSRIQRWITDIRVHAAALGQSITVSDIFWGRALSIFGDGKLNTHQDAGVIPIFVRERDQADGRILDIEQDLNSGKLNQSVLEKLQKLQSTTNSAAKSRAEKVVANRIQKIGHSIESFQDLEKFVQVWPFNKFSGLIALNYLSRFNEPKSFALSASAILKSNIFDNEVKSQIRANLNALLIEMADQKVVDMSFRDLIELADQNYDTDLKRALLNILYQKSSSASEMLMMAEHLKVEPYIFRARIGQAMSEKFNSLTRTPEQIERWNTFYSHPVFGTSSNKPSYTDIQKGRSSIKMCSKVFAKFNLLQF